MHFNTIALVSSLIAGGATVLGAVPLLFKKSVKRNSLDAGIGFSAGIMLAASFIALILPGIQNGVALYGKILGVWPCMLGLLAGYAGLLFIHDKIPHEHLIKGVDVSNTRHLGRVALIIIAICLHNFPEGLSIGVGFGASGLEMGVMLAVAIAIQNIPEGFVVAIGLMSVGASRQRTFWLTFASGMIEPLAALVGFISTKIAAHTVAFSLGFAGGAMLFVICHEMLPELFREGHEKRSSLGLILGIILMLCLDQYLVI